MSRISFAIDILFLLHLKSGCVAVHISQKTGKCGSELDVNCVQHNVIIKLKGNTFAFRPLNALIHLQCGM